MSKRVRARTAIAALSVVTGVGALMPPGPVGADGTETLGPPSVPIAAGSGVVTDGTGMFTQPGTVSVDVPANATVEQVLVYWEGYNTSANLPDNTIRVNGTEVEGTLIGGPTLFFGNVSSTSWRADITSHGVITPGANDVQLSDLAFDFANDGASIVVIYDDSSGPADIQVRDGNDNAFRDFAPPLDTTAPQTFTVTAASFRRDTKLHLMVGGVDVNRSSVVRVTAGDEVTEYPDLLGNSDGPQWDDVTVDVSIPPNATTVTVQVLSEGDRGDGPASLTWVAAILATSGAGGTCTPPVPTQAVTHGSAYGVDAKLVGGLVKVGELGHVSSVAPGEPSSQSSQLLTANVPLLVSAKVLGNSSSSELDPSTSTASSTVADVNLLSGLVKATTVRAVSQSNASPFSSSYNSKGSVIQGLTVGGKRVAVAPNLRVKVNVFLLGTVAELHVMEEKGTSSFQDGVSTSSHSMNALRLVLLKNYLGLPAGTTVVIAHAESDAQSPISSCPDVKSVSGEAFTAYVDGDLAGEDLVEAKVGDAVLPPTGGSDTDGVAADIPGVVTSVTAYNTTSGSLDPNPHATSRSIVEGVNVLNGVVTAKVLDVRSTSSADGTTAGTTFASNFVDLRVDGQLIVASGQVAPSSHLVVDLGALGYVSVVLNEQVVNTGSGSDTEGTVNAIHARVYTPGGLLQGEVIVASAHSDAHV